jgi:hypothetical protein
MATLFSSGLNVPNDKVVTLARAYGIVQQPEETVQDAIERLENALIASMKRPAIQMVKRDKIAAELAAETNDIITEI